MRKRLPGRSGRATMPGVKLLEPVAPLIDLI
jgi:hypothetical protein